MIFYNAVSGNYVGSLSGLGYNYSLPPLQSLPVHLDVDDGNLEIHTVESGPKISVFQWK